MRRDSSENSLGFCNEGAGANRLQTRRPRSKVCRFRTEYQCGRRRSGAAASCRSLSWLPLPDHIDVLQLERYAMTRFRESAISPFMQRPPHGVLADSDSSLLSPFPESDMPTLPLPDGAAVPDLRPHWEGIRSSETEERTMILFENLSDSGVVVEVNWIDFNGQEISYGWLEPGKSRFQPTYVGHPWVIRDSNTGEALLLFVTQNALGAAVIHPGHRVEYSYPL